MDWREDSVAADVALYGNDVLAHHDLAVTADGRLIGFSSGGSSFWVLDAEGRLVAEWESDLGEGHGLTLVGEELWVADPGVAFARDDAGVYETLLPEVHGRVVVIGLDGDRVAELPRPAWPAYDDGATYRPTTVDVDGDTVWVADGYGGEVVHKLSRDGELLLTLTGEEGAGRFDTPHGVFVDRRRAGDPQLYVTDSVNNRIVVYDLDGTFLRAIDGLRTPIGLAVSGDELVVAELEARLTILDADDRVVEHIGDDANAPERPGWPNALGPGGRTVRPQLHAGRFNSPHGLAVDAAGTIYVAEWVLDGRIISLRRGR